MQLNNLCGIDIGCTNVKMTAIVNGKQINSTIPSGDNFSRNELISNISDFYLSFNNQFSGLGIAFSGCTSDNLHVCRTTLPCLNNLSAEDFSHLNCPKVRLINDANATALAGNIEYPNSKVLVGITNGTGIGCGITINGKLFTGVNGLAGEIYGNPIILPYNKITKVGKLCSGSKILKKLRSLKPITVKDQEIIVRNASMHFGSMLVSLIHSYNPDIIYLSGGGFEFPNFFEHICQFVHQYAYPDFLTNLKIVKSEFSTYSGCLGAMKFLVES